MWGFLVLLIGVPCVYAVPVLSLFCCRCSVNQRNPITGDKMAYVRGKGKRSKDDITNRTGNARGNYSCSSFVHLLI